MTHTWRVAAFYVFGKRSLRLVNADRQFYFDLAIYSEVITSKTEKYNAPSS